MRDRALIGAVALALTGCGATAAPPSDGAVVRAWAAAVSSGDAAAATAHFDPPVELWSAAGRTRLVTRRAVRFFNETLPCGAKVVRALDVGPLVLADFRLTGCADAGRIASVVLELHDRRITRWLMR